MSDVAFIAAVIAFFVLCSLYVILCDRMIGPDDVTSVPPTETAESEVSA